ncbi:hypothetical protein DFH09DRAFT_1094718 [Mycena vulgaris]|nr:hypothetical protein DFH09DRAFT_1094718 [Mycena vulgaris]
METTTAEQLADLSKRDGLLGGRACIYTTERLPSFGDYSQVQRVDDSIHVKHPTSSDNGPASSRDIMLHDRRFRISSLNSKQTPYYPGPRDPDTPYDPPLPSDPRQRRRDGHLGPPDPTVSPQYYSQREPWLAFIRRDFSARQDGFAEILPEVKLYDVWVGEPNSPLGAVPLDIIDQLVTINARWELIVQRLLPDLADRPELQGIPLQTPSSDEIRALGRLHPYETGVDELRRIQRLMAKKEAWIRMAKAWTAPQDSLSAGAFPPADELLMGVWVNGESMSQQDYHWFVERARVPCFSDPRRDFAIVRDRQQRRIRHSGGQVNASHPPPSTSVASRPPSGAIESDSITTSQERRRVVIDLTTEEDEDSPALSLVRI